MLLLSLTIIIRIGWRLLERLPSPLLEREECVAWGLGLVTQRVSLNHCEGAFYLDRALITTLSAAPGVNKLQPADNAAVLQWSYCHEVVAIMSAHLGTGHSGYTARYYRGSLKRPFFWTTCGL